DDFIARSELRDTGFGHGAGGVDTRRMRIVAGNATVAAGRERILVIERGVADANQHLAGRQVSSGALDHLGVETAIGVLADVQCFESCHLLSPYCQNRCSFSRLQPLSRPRSMTEPIAMPNRSGRLFFST